MDERPPEHSSAHLGRQHHLMTATPRRTIPPLFVRISSFVVRPIRAAYEDERGLAGLVMA